MQLFTVIGAAALLAGAAAATSHADGSSTVATGGLVVQTPLTACDGPGPGYRSGLRRRHSHRFHAHYVRRLPRIAVVEPPDLFNSLLPGTLDTAYDRAMTIHFRSPPVTDTYRAEAGWPPTPPVVGLFPYRVRAWGAVYDYDGIVGQYVALAQPDARRAA